MHPEFGFKREQNNTLFFETYDNISGKFHFHSQIELMFVETGEIEVWVNNGRRVLTRGEMSVALSYDAHTYRSIGRSSATIIFIPTYMCEEFISSVKDKRASNHFVCDSDAVSRVRECFERIKQAKKDQNKMVVTGYIYVMLGILAEFLGLEETGKAVDHDLSSQLLFYINENYKNDISLSSISSFLGYNPSYISRYFKSCFNIGVSQYIKAVRLKSAVTLLHENKYNVTYCALESGFNSMRTFYRAFSEEFRCSPREYIDRIKAQT